jgi:hypothetical protein
MENIIETINYYFYLLKNIFYEQCYKFGLNQDQADIFGYLIIGLLIGPILINLLRHFSGILLLIKLFIFFIIIYILVTVNT